MIPTREELLALAERLRLVDDVLQDDAAAFFDSNVQPHDAKLAEEDAEIHEQYLVSIAIIDEAATALRQIAEAMATQERENADLIHDIERHIKIASDLATENTAMRERLEAAEKDAERWRVALKIGFPVRNHRARIYDVRWTVNGDFFGATPTVAIDAARAEAQKEE